MAAIISIILALIKEAPGIVAIVQEIIAIIKGGKAKGIPAQKALDAVRSAYSI